MCVNDHASIRLERLLSLKKKGQDEGAFIKWLMENCSGRDSYWRDLLAGKKSFGEKKARAIEKGLDLDPGWLDQWDAPANHQEKAPVGDEAYARLLARLTKEHRELVEAYRTVLPEDRSDLVKPLLERAALMRRLEENLQKKIGVKGVAPWEKVKKIAAAPVTIKADESTHAATLSDRKLPTAKKGVKH